MYKNIILHKITLIFNALILQGHKYQMHNNQHSQHKNLKQNKKKKPSGYWLTHVYSPNYYSVIVVTIFNITDITRQINYTQKTSP